MKVHRQGNRGGVTLCGIQCRVAANFTWLPYLTGVEAYVTCKRCKRRKWKDKSVFFLYGNFSIPAGVGKTEVRFVQRTCGYFGGEWTIRDRILARGAAAYHARRRAERAGKEIR